MNDLRDIVYEMVYKCYSKLPLNEYFVKRSGLAKVDRQACWLVACGSAPQGGIVVINSIRCLEPF